MEKEGNNLFQVNLKGMIALLSEHIYSNPNTFVRELLQNSVDAITALHNIDENYSGRIDVFLNGDGSMVFQDNGIGLKEEEVYRFLTVIGESSKRDTPDADDFIGRFGIGLLSCFVVTNEIRVESRSSGISLKSMESCSRRQLISCSVRYRQAAWLSMVRRRICFLLCSCR